MIVINNIIRKAFSITLFLFVLLGIITVFGQKLAIMLGNTNLSLWLEEYAQFWAIVTSGICGMIAFVYLLISPKESQRDEDE